VAILNQINPVSALVFNYSKIFSIITLPSNLVLPRVLFLEVSTLKLCMYLFLPTHGQLLTDSLSKPHIKNTE